AKALQRAKPLREALFLIISAMIFGKVPPQSAMDLVSQHWRAGVAAHELRYEEPDVRLKCARVQSISTRSPR
ncbi:MAG TPA: hypothetical protein VGL55_12785, partial [Steroidobacteraceae bacterium]